MKSELFLILLFTFPIPWNVIAAPFTENGNGIVIDQKTDLIWQKCSMGQNIDSTCSGTAIPATWINAISYCENLTLAGRSNWRLPNVNELKSILDETLNNPAIDTSHFPETVASYYWSSSTYLSDTSAAWRVYFYDGDAGTDDRMSSYYVRCVAGP